MNSNNENNGLNLSLADQTYLRWYEITNALSHTHVDAIFSRFRQQLSREIRKAGSAEMTTLMVIRCFQDATLKVARTHTISRFASTVELEDEAA